MPPETSTLISADATREILLIHTAIDGMGIAVSIILLRALLALRRDGAALPGMLLLLFFMLLTELLRAAWLAFLWFSLPAPLPLDFLAFLTGFIVLVGVPVTASARYLPKQAGGIMPPRPWIWLQRGMVLTAVLGFGVLLGAIGFHLRTAVFLGPAAAYVLTTIFLVSRYSFFRHLQVRRRPLLLFLVFVVTGLLVLAFVGAFTIVTQVRIRQSLALASLNGVGLILVLCGIVFLFANVRQADVIVKRSMRIILWTCGSLLTWFVLMHSGSFGLPSKDGRNVLALTLLFVGFVTAPAIERGLNECVDRWVFEQPDTHKAVATLWGKLLSTEDFDDALLVTESSLQQLLGLAAVRVQSVAGEIGKTKFHPSRPGPHFISRSSPMAGILNPPADILFPLFVDGHTDYVIALSHGAVRPALMQWEIDLVERMAGRLQIWLGMRSAAERTRRETSLREELAEAELRALRAQVNPHFLFNSLNTIADLAVVAPAQAEEMTVRLSSVFRYVLISTDRHFTSLKEELEFARSYLHIEQTRFGDRLKLGFEIDPSTLDQQIPTLLLQPLIENALKHGIAPRREGGTLTICSRTEGESVLIWVADDGVGLKERAVPSQRSTRVGVENVIKRLRTAYGARAWFTLRKGKHGGTEALIRIPRG